MLFKTLINKYYELLDFCRKARGENVHIITYITGLGLDRSNWDIDGVCKNCDYGIDCDVANNYGERETPKLRFFMKKNMNVLSPVYIAKLYFS